MTANNYNVVLMNDRQESIHQINRSLLEENAFLFSALQCIDGGIILCDCSGKIVLMNSEGERLTGWTTAQAKGMNLERVFSVFDLQTELSVVPFLQKILKTGINEQFDNNLVLRNNDGKDYRISIRVSLHKQNGNIIGLIIIFNDETNSCMIKAELQKRERIQAMKSLASTIAHDYNNILTAILGNTSLAMMCLDTRNNIGELLEKIEKGCFRARDFNQKLLTFSAENQPLTEKTDIPELFSSIKLPASDNPNINYLINTPESIWSVEIDRSQIRSSIEKILNNSVQAMPTGGFITISFSNIIVDVNNTLLLDPGRYVRIEIKDDGTGIPLVYQDRIFEPFFTTKQKGAGLSLAFCYSSLKRHNGTITVKSEDGFGSVFSLFLPALKAVQGSFET